MLANYNLRGQEAPAKPVPFFLPARRENLTKILRAYLRLYGIIFLHNHPRYRKESAPDMADERNERNRAIDLAIANIEKQFGKG